MDALLAASADQAYAEPVDATRGRRAEVGRRLLDEPDRARSEAADALRRLWKAVVEPEWPSMRQALRAEMLDRAIQVNREGLRAVLARLHPSAACGRLTVSWGRPDQGSWPRSPRRCRRPRWPGWWVSPRRRPANTWQSCETRG